jgi:hypothetical protein
METCDSPYGELPPKPPEPPLRVAEWPMERLLWELEWKVDPQRLAIIAFELEWRNEHEV